ncbi:MAG TPA: sigma 54-interacting transcriptional regulator [Vicinamibacterales bacterium]
MIGASPAFTSTLRVLDRYARYDVAVLIVGETGTGKELAARAIHYRSSRAGGPFVPVNCGALPDSLIENELFGHERGAYTDARAGQTGLVRAAHNGTLFLDEIDALSPKAQVTLLRFLQDAHYRPVGAARQEYANVRVISATNATLEDLVARGTFRSDLLYRLEILRVVMPPLRERSGDPALLARHFVTELSQRFSEPVKQVSAETLAWFDRYAWPGNVRELENLVCRSYVLTEGDVLHLPEVAPREPETPTSEPLPWFSSAKAAAIESFERRYLESVLVRTRGNVTLAAALAGTERRALGKLLKKHHIDRERFLRRA